MQRGGGASGTLQGKPGGKAKLPHWPADSSDFDKHRKIHYNEGKFLKTLKSLPLTSEDDSSGTSASISSSSQSGLTDPKPRPAEKGWPGRLAPGVKNDTVLVTDSRGLDANG